MPRAAKTKVATLSAPLALRLHQREKKIINANSSIRRTIAGFRNLQYSSTGGSSAREKKKSTKAAARNSKVGPCELCIESIVLST